MKVGVVGNWQKVQPNNHIKPLAGSLGVIHFSGKGYYED